MEKILNYKCRPVTLLSELIKVGKKKKKRIKEKDGESKRIKIGKRSLKKIQT